MYDRFTDRARKVMQLADSEGRRLSHEYIGTDHILLGLVEEGGGVAANVLRNLDIDLREIRQEVERIVEPGPEGVSGRRLPLTPLAARVIEYSKEEAGNLHHNHVGTEHLLLGLLREEECLAAKVLANLGLTLDAVRGEILNLLGPSSPSEEAAGSFPEAEVQDLPAEARQTMAELDARIEQLICEKEEAVAEFDFRKAADLWEQAAKLRKRREQVIREWRNR